MAWTKLKDTEIWKSAEARYAANGLAYHSFDHALDLYSYAEKLQIPYNTRLDLCILAHDVIMDLGPGENEKASATWLSDQIKSGPYWGEPILATIEHRPDGPHAVLALLDLMSFTDPVASTRNTELLLEEARKVKGDAFDHAAWLKGSLAYLTGLEGRISEGLDRLPPDAPWRREWQDIAGGIRETIRLRGAKIESPALDM